MDPTEATLLMVENHRESSEHARVLAIRAHENAPTCEQVQLGIWTVEQAEMFNLADSLKDWIDDELDDMPVVTFRDSLRCELARASYCQVSWPEMARHFRDIRIENMTA